MVAEALSREELQEIALLTKSQRDIDGKEIV